MPFIYLTVWYNRHCLATKTRTKKPDEHSIRCIDPSAACQEFPISHGILVISTDYE